MSIHSVNRKVPSPIELPPNGGLQSSELVAGLNHPAWGEIANKHQQFESQVFNGVLDLTDSQLEKLAEIADTLSPQARLCAQALIYLGSES